MAICTHCAQEMLTAAGCAVDALIIDSKRYARDRVDRDTAPYGRCGDCGAEHGGFHHPGCDLEPCPRCGWQLISCGCWSDEENDEFVA